MQDPAHKASQVPSMRPGGGRSYVLRFISGKYQGGEFPIVNDKPIIVGRSSDLDMVLVEDMVSRKHARITMQQDQIWIEDLGSTNGSFVNGEKIKLARLKEGDRVLIGTSILKVIAGEGAARADSTDAKANLENVAAARRTTSARTRPSREFRCLPATPGVTGAISPSSNSSPPTSAGPCPPSSSSMTIPPSPPRSRCCSRCTTSKR
jgi:pSer/pThr/pTyr-binding forkhead associated (FHA) protein